MIFVWVGDEMEGPEQNEDSEKDIAEDGAHGIRVRPSRHSAVRIDGPGISDARVGGWGDPGAS